MDRRCVLTKCLCKYSRDIALQSMETWRGETVDCNAATVSLGEFHFFMELIVWGRGDQIGLKSCCVETFIIY
jgi:hypothetical protein